MFSKGQPSILFNCEEQHTVADSGIIAIAGLGIALGLRHGIDWDHIAAITDITSSVVGTEEAAAQERRAAIGAPNMSLASGVGATAVMGSATIMPGSTYTSTPSPERARHRQEMRRGFFLATMYALGHATLVVLLGIVAIWLGAVLPDWIDPIMERIVGVTLLVLGGWIIYSLIRYGRNFRLQSRWMVVFSLFRQGWNRIRSKVSGERIEHSHNIANYGPKTAYGIGLLHGIGAETGSQAVLLAGAAGATTRATGSLLLLFFTIGLLISNSLVAAFSATGFVSASTKRTLFVIVGVFAAIFSLIVGFLFVTGQGTALPDFEGILNWLFGSIPGTN
jgi:cytochrome c biogenesis protein CcdA